MVDNLILTVHVSFEDVLNSNPVQIRTLDGRSITTCFDELVSPQTVRTIVGEGMPRSNPEENQNSTPVKLLPFDKLPKGDLYLRFDIHFPKNLSNASRLAIIASLKQNEADLGL